jgi:glycosyltransferase involved in cell wall biosynthesis
MAFNSIGDFILPNNKKALIVVENAPVPLDVRVWQEATTLRDAGWSVSIICPTAPQDQPGDKGIPKLITKEVLEGVRIYRFPLTFAEQGIFDYLNEYLSAFIVITRLCGRLWRRDRFNILHFCNPPDIFFPIAIFYRLLGARVVFDHHDLFPEFVAWRYRGMTGRLLYTIARVAEYLTFRCANMIISTNESYRRIAMKRGGVPANRVTVVRNGPKRDQFTPVEPVPLLKRDFPYMACYAGVMGLCDGVQELLLSIRHIVHDLDRHDILFVLLGDGAIYSQAQKNVTNWGLQEVTFMPGMIRDKLLLRQYLCTADVLLSPEPLTPVNNCSTFVKVAEYMVMGKPVVAFDLKETRHTAQKAALYVEPGNTKAYGDAIVSLLDNPELRDQMGSIGRQRVLEQLCWEHQEQNLLQAYMLALGKE